jgi:peptide/nickel transport system permease protein
VQSNSIALLRLVATAGAIVLIMLVVLGVFSTSHLASFPQMFNGKIIAELFSYLPRTIELIAVSFVVASIAGVLSALSTARAVRALIASVVLGLQCIPFFWLAIAVQFVFGAFGKNPIAGTGGFTGHLSDLFAPVVVLALFLFPLIAEPLSRRLTLGPNLRTAAPPILGALAEQFARDLPDLLTATIITEIVFAWPGAGRLFWHSLHFAARPEPAALLLLMALSVLLARFLSVTLIRREATDSHA